MSDTTSGTTTPGPECARYEIALATLAQGGADTGTLAETRAHVAGCAYCAARLAAYDALDAALVRAYGTAVSRDPAVEVTEILRLAAADENYAGGGAAHQPPGDTHRRHTYRPYRASRRLTDLVGIAAAVLIAIAVAALLLSHAGFAQPVGTGGRTPVPGNTQPPVQPTVNPTTAPGPAIALDSITMVSPTTGWAVTSHGGIARTMDGGAHWADVTPPGEQVLVLASNTALRVISGDEAWMADIQSPCTRIWHTMDGGQSWVRVAVPLPTGQTAGPAICGAPIFVDAQHGWLMEGLGAAAGSEGVAIFRTTDGGVTWSEISEAAYNNTAPGALPFGGDKTGMAFVSASTGWVTGTSPAPGFWLYMTRDGGRTWHQQTPPLPAGVSAQAQVVTAAPVFFSATNGVLPVMAEQQQGPLLDFYVTDDGGQTWTPTPAVPSGKAGLWSFSDAAHWWATDGKSIYASSDAGQSWTTIAPTGALNSNVTSFDMVTSDVGYAVVMDSGSGGGSLIKTTDGGRSWAAVAGTPAGAPACQSGQLAVQFRAGGYATGNDTGELLVRNVSSSACSLQGKVDFYGVDAQGKRIAGSGMNQTEVLPPVVLPPNTPAVPPHVQATAGAYLIMGLLGAYRDDPSAPNGLCSAANEVTPTVLVISVGSVTLQAANYDAAGGSDTSMVGCHGVILGEGAGISS